jgi:hypothetical protein
MSIREDDYGCVSVLLVEASRLSLQGNQCHGRRELATILRWRWSGRRLVVIDRFALAVDGLAVGDGLELGDGVVVGEGVAVGDGVTVGDGPKPGDGVAVGAGGAMGCPGSSSSHADAVRNMITSATLRSSFLRIGR